MLAEDVEEKEGFTTTENAGDNLYHPIAFCQNEFFQVCFTLKIHCFMTFFCVMTQFSVANIRFLLDNAQLFHRFNSSETIKKGHEQSCPLAEIFKKTSTAIVA